MEKKRIGIVGSTGSIGKQAVEVVANNQDLFEVVFLATYSNENLLNNQKELLNCSNGILLKNDKNYSNIKNIINNEKLDLILHSPSGIDSTIIAYEIVSKGINIALANKECIVSAGKIITNTAKNNNSQIIPVDSEHSAIFQCLMGQNKRNIKNITLTASGGPFRNFSLNEMSNITLKDALNHPNWSMGQKITVDSATMMNKGLELIEAYYLFDTEPEVLKVVVHPESIVHSFVTFNDGSIIAQMGKPSMKVPISFALGYPNRINSGENAPDLTEICSLNFEKPDLNRFACLKIAIDVLNSKSNALMTAMNVANEVAVNSFINKEISFLSISNVISETLSKISFSDTDDINQICLNNKKSFDIALSVVANMKK